MFESLLQTGFSLLLQGGATPDGIGGNTYATGSSVSFKGSIRVLSARDQVVVGGKQTSNTTHRIYALYPLTGLTKTCKITFQGNTYQVEDFDNVAGSDRLLQIDVRRLDA